MRYALVRDDTIEQIGAPDTWFDGTRWWDFREHVDPESGWQAIVPTERPPCDPAQTLDYSITLVDGQPTETWTQRPKSDAEVEVETRATNTQELMTDATAGIDELFASMAAIDMMTALTDAAINSKPAAHLRTIANELKATERQLLRITRLYLGQTGSADTGP